MGNFSCAPRRCDLQEIQEINEEIFDVPDSIATLAESLVKPVVIEFHDREYWMTEFLEKSPKFGDRNLWMISIPGTHHSAVWRAADLPGADWAICQSISIHAQLMAGIRYFDFRICDDNPFYLGEIFISHTIWSNTYLSEPLTVVKEFLDAHPKEMAICSFAKDKIRTLSPQGLEKARNFTQNLFGKVVVYKKDSHLTINELLKVGKRVVITEDGSSSHFHMRKSSWIKTRSDHVSNLFELLDKYLRKNPKFIMQTIHLFECLTTGWTLPIYWISGETNREIVKRLDSAEWKDYEINVLLHDFANDEIIEKTIERNNRFIDS